MAKKTLHNFHIDIPVKSVLSRLGKRVKTKLTPKVKSKIDKLIALAMDFITPSAVFDVFDLNLEKKKKDRLIILNNGLKIISKKLFDLFKDSEKCVIIACTIGSEISAKVQEFMDYGNMSDAVILDAIGSETVEEAVNYVNNIVERQMRLHGYKLTRRFSPGYGDLDLSYQKDFLNILEADEIDITVNKNNIMQPEKSITALIGLEQ